MRQRKFRGHSELIGHRQGFIYGAGCYVDQSSKAYIIDDTTGKPDFIRVREIQESTGFEDKNGQPIWEGDLLLIFDEEVMPVTDEGQGPIEACNHIAAVEMRNGVFGFEIPSSDYGETGWYGLSYWIEEISNEGYEVIGNISQNPELLK